MEIVMDNEQFDKLLSFYKEHMDEIYDLEDYKWKALVNFKEEWDLDAPNFAEMLEKALGKTGNLLVAGNYYPIRTIINAAKKSPKAVRDAFQSLYSFQGKDGVRSFRNIVSELHSKAEPGTKTYLDDRAISVLLFLKYPEKHYLYKYRMLKVFAKLVNLKKVPPRGKWAIVEYYYNLCQKILKLIKKDTALIDAYGDRAVVDSEYHLLVQDIIYSVYYYYNPSLLNNHKIDYQNESRRYAETSKKQHYNPIWHYIFQQQKRLKELGNQGEEFVYKIERRTVKKYNLSPSKKVRWVSKINEHLGFDILSYDEDGNKKYIEVKTTCGSKESKYYLTENEFATSLIYGKQYYIYRIYHFDIKKKTGEIDIQRGPLTELPKEPILYLVTPR